MANVSLCITTLSAKKTPFHKPLIDSVFIREIDRIFKVMEFGHQSHGVWSPICMGLRSKVNEFAENGQCYQ